MHGNVGFSENSGRSRGGKEEKVLGPLGWPGCGKEAGESPGVGLCLSFSSLFAQWSVRGWQWQACYELGHDRSWWVWLFHGEIKEVTLVWVQIAVRCVGHAGQKLRGN